jgi:hypothetical protein
LSEYAQGVSTLGPFPEQPFFHPRIPTIDLRDAIRMDHGLLPLDEMEPLKADTYSEHPLLPVFPLKQPMTRAKEQSIWGVDGIGTIFVMCVIGVVAWSINPALIVGVIVVGIVLVAILARLR